jgi:hypothetical protein
MKKALGKIFLKKFEKAKKNYYSESINNNS